MPLPLRIATFNLQELDDKAGATPSLAERIQVMRPQLERVDADVLCLQEVFAQPQDGGGLQLSALQKLVQGTQYAGFNAATTTLQQPRNLVTLSRFPILN